MNIFEAQKIATAKIAALHDSGESADWINATIARIPEYAIRYGFGHMLPAAALAKIVQQVGADFDLPRIHRFFG